MSQSHDAWWVVPGKKPGAAKRLFCLPYAGGNGTVFHQLAQTFDASVEVHSMMPPGRGFRLRERAFDDFDALVEALVLAIEPRLDRPYALFGHSMGGLVAFELTRALRRRGAPLPAHLFASASQAPSRWISIPLALSLESAALWRAANELYGTPLEGELPSDLLDLVVPPLRTDLKLLERYRYAEEAPLTLPITALVGSRDTMVTRETAAGWARETTGAFAVHEVPGPHLFLQESVAQVGARLRASWR